MKAHIFISLVVLCNAAYAAEINLGFGGASKESDYNRGAPLAGIIVDWKYITAMHVSNLVKWDRDSGTNTLTAGLQFSPIKPWRLSAGVGVMDKFKMSTRDNPIYQLSFRSVFMPNLKWDFRYTGSFDGRYKNATLLYMYTY